ncbi:MAG TPA: hypothetical protein VIG51_10015 [Candidatus Baltobacteraceae bacterium]
MALAALCLTPATSHAAQPIRETKIKGVVTAFDGRFDLHLRDARGHIHDVTLHHGTIINPTGLTLTAGMHVTILGNAQPGTLAANEIDTPYHLVAASPAYLPRPAFYGFGYSNPAFYNPYFGNPYWNNPYWGDRFYGARYVPDRADKDTQPAPQPRRAPASPRPSS